MYKPYNRQLIRAWNILLYVVSWDTLYLCEGIKLFPLDTISAHHYDHNKERQITSGTEQLPCVFKNYREQSISPPLLDSSKKQWWLMPTPEKNGVFYSLMEQNIRGWDIVQYIKCLECKCLDLSLDPQHMKASWWDPQGELVRWALCSGVSPAQVNKV